MASAAPNAGANANEAQSGQVAIDIANKDQMSGLKAGEYLIHVFIEETRALKHPESDDSTVDPVLKVEATSHHRISKAKENVGSGATYWGEHFFFEKNYTTSFEAEKETIVISVLDHNSFGPNALIGNVEFNLSAIYQKPKHCLQYQWAALSGLTKKFREVLGFIKFSIGVFHSDDDQVHFEDEKILDNAGGKPMDVLYPPQIETQTFQIRVRVFRGENLKKMDSLLGKCDPYIKIDYAGMIIESKVLKVTLDPLWNEEILIPASLPSINDKLNLKLIDWDAPPQVHETMGTHLFSIKDIQAGMFKNPFWINIYGPPSGANKKFEKIYTEVPETATEWQARLQLAIDMREEQKPTLLARPIPDQRVLTASQQIRRDKYQLRAEIHYALNLPKESKYFVKVRWGKAEVMTSKRESKNKVIEFYESLVLEDNFPVSTLDNLEIPDVFVYLNDTTKDFSFVRQPYTEFTKIDAKAQCYYFMMDHAVTAKRDDLAGIVKMRLYLTKTDERDALAKYGWSNQVPRRNPVSQWKVHVNVFQAKGLVSGDSSGLSDPFLVANCFGTERQTSVIDNTLNPIWNERLEFVTAFDSVQDAYPLALTLWDKDTLSNDFIGSAIIVLDETHLNPKGKVKPQWVPLKFGKAKGDFGSLLLSICCYNQAELIPKSVYIEPDMQRYFLNLKIIGLRELKSVGILPVKRAFVRFDLDSVARRGDKALLHDKKYIRTEPVNSGSNPNILTVINLDFMLPIDPEYCPSMNCAVFDYVFKGLSQPLVGNFSIPLEKYIRKTQLELDKRIETLTKLYNSYREAEKKKEMQAAQELRALDTTNLEESKGEDSSPRLTKQPSNVNNVDINIDTSKDDAAKVAEESDSYVVKAKYNAEGEEINKPDPAKFMELGHTSKKDQTSTKHYRYYLNNEFEKSALYDESPFDEIPIFRGRQVTDESFLKSLMGGREDYKQVGEFKAMINIMSENEKMRYDAKLAHVGHYASTKGLEFSDEEFLKKRDVLVRVYVIEADDLPDKDDDSNSDPYVVLKLGDTVYNEHKNWQLDCPNPKIHKCYEFSATFPGAGKLHVELWDHDDLVRDDLIGATVIDLEDRWFSPKWRILKNIPIETRKLYHPSSKLPQGTVKLWVDIIPRDLKKPPIWKIAPKPPMEFELRVIVWECKDVPRVDFEDCVDIFINGRLDDGQHHRTDTHFRSQNGFGSFNWRMVYPVTLPMKKHRITFQIMDKDLLSANDYISEASLDFTTDAMRAYEKEIAVTIMGGNFRNEEKFWVPCSNTKVAANGKTSHDSLGEILVSMQLIPKDEAKKNPVGQGRGDPNQNPFLPPPTGRIAFTLNPLKMFEQMVGPKMRRKIYQYLCLGCCLVLLIALAPIIVANVITKAF